MRVLVDADMIAHEVGHLRHNVKDENGIDLIDEETGRAVKGDLFNPETVSQIAVGRLFSIISGSEAGGWKAFLSRGKHYRHKLATILPYKGHREDSPRNNVDYVKEHLHQEMGAVWCSDNEADDEMAKEQWSDIITVGSKFGYDDDILRDHTSVVIASRDKDLRTVPGWKFTWWLKGAKDEDGVEIPEEKRQVEKGKIEWISIAQAFRNFYQQLLTGDTADNIKGLYGVGLKSAWVKQLADLDEEEDMYDHVEEKYFKHYGPHYGEIFLKENAMLLHMQRRDDDQWLPPAERDEHYWYL